MRRAGLVVAETLELLREAVRPGITTADLDAVAEQHIRSRGATSNFLGYHGVPGHDLRERQRRDRPRHPGPPGPARGRHRLHRLRRDRRRLARRRRHHGPGRRGRPSELTELHGGHRGARCGTAFAAVAARAARLSDIGHAVETYVRQRGRLRHRRGVRRARHRHRDAPGAERPQLRQGGPRPGAGPGSGARRRADGQPGSRQTRQLDDGWTVVTQDGRRSAHFEHTVRPHPGRPVGAHRPGRRRAALEALGVGVPAFG